MLSRRNGQCNDYINSITKYEKHILKYVWKRMTEMLKLKWSYS